MKKYDAYTVLDIDLEHLEIELLEIGSQIGYYGRMCADAEMDTIKSEEELKRIKSEIILSANKNTTWLKGAKVTDVKVEAFYRSNERYKEAKDEWIDNKHKHERLKSLIYGLNAKKQALDNLVRLAAIDYFSSPNSPRTALDIMQKHIDKKEQRQKEEIAKKLKIRKKVEND